MARGGSVCRLEVEQNETCRQRENNGGASGGKGHVLDPYLARRGAVSFYVQKVLLVETSTLLARRE